MTAPIEVTTRYATSVDELADAWAFVMAHVDKVGADPYIGIKPLWSSGDDFTQRRFEVVVSGMVEETR